LNENRFPLVPLALGVAGLVPFVGLAGALAFDTGVPGLGNAEAARTALVVYAIAILSFLGGVRWGIALGQEDQAKATRDYIIAVIPALAGWAAIALEEPRDLWLLCIAFVALGLMDYGLACRTVAPEWYGRLRLALSAVAALALGLAAVS
jgi:Protein of unknown function (DUF3429)